MSTRNLVRDGVGSLLVHVGFVLFVVFAPDVTVYSDSRQVLSNFKEPTRLIYPRSLELTQKAPNQGKVSKELDARSAVQAQPAQTPHVRQFSPPPPGRAGEPAPLPSPQIEAPQIQTGPLTAQIPTAGPGTASLNPFQAPRPNPAAAPKLPPSLSRPTPSAPLCALVARALLSEISPKTRQWYRA